MWICGLLLMPQVLHDEKVQQHSSYLGFSKHSKTIDFRRLAKKKGYRKANEHWASYTQGLLHCQAIEGGFGHTYILPKVGRNNSHFPCHNFPFLYKYHGYLVLGFNLLFIAQYRVPTQHY
jgi:hypothetical protein